MKKRFYALFWAFALLPLLLSVPIQAQAQSGNTVNQTLLGKKTITVAQGQEITYYDPEGTGMIEVDEDDGYQAQSMTVFKPAVAGQVIQITFEKVELKGSTTSTPALLKVYSGDPDPENKFPFTKQQPKFSDMKLPAGNVLGELTGTHTNKVYTSSAADGSIAVGFLFYDAVDCDGWVAKVKCVSTTPMQITGAGSSYDHVSATPTLRSNINLATAYVQTAGFSNADALTQVNFTLPINESAVDPMTLKLYKGDAKSFNNAEPLAAALTQNGTTYTFTLEDALVEGRNTYSVVGSFKGDAAIGAKVQVNISGLATKAQPAGISGFTAASPVTVSVPSVVLMSNEDQTVTVGNTPLNFYDDGGKDGKVSAGFNGKITFLPADGTKKVMVDFTKMKIAYGSIYKQSISVYSGKDVKPTALLRTFVKDNTGTVRSTSADGALTVVFKSDNSNTDDGFEAIVSQFTPQPMTVKAAEVKQITEGTVCAGDTDEQILSVKLTTENTSPVLKVKNFKFTTNNTFAQVAKATLYYTKTSNAFSTAKKVGETAVTADAFTIQAASEIELMEGDNYFWLVYDVQELAVNGQKIDATAVSVTFENTTHTFANGNPDGDRTVQNMVFALEGSRTKMVNGTMEFKSQPNSFHSNKYEGGTSDRVTTFVPAHAGHVVQIDFSKFNLYYSSNNFQTRAVFRVYSGKNATGTPLWELSSAADKDKGPGHILRSTSADGALTIVFNPKSSTSYYLGEGFVAQVKEYQSKPMTLGTVTAEQASTDIVSAGEKDKAVLSFNVQTAGDKNALELQAVTLNLKGSQKNIDKVAVFSAGTDNQVLSATPLVTLTSLTAGDATVVLPLATPFQLSEGNNWFRVHYDVKADAKAEDKLDAAVTGVKVSGTEQAVTTADPDGERVIKNLYSLKSGANDEKVIAAGTSLLVYDDGGPAGDESRNFTGTITFAPKTAGDVVKLLAKSWHLTYADKMYVYYGDRVKEKEDFLLDRKSEGTEIVSKAADGKLTIKYVTKTTVGEGFEIEVSAFTPAQLSVQSVSVEATAPAKIVKGQTNVRMLHVQMAVEGDKGTLDVTKFNVGATGEAVVSNVHVYQTDKEASFAENNVFGSASSVPYVVNGQYTIADKGTYHFWITYDVKATATIGTAVSAQLNGITVSGSDVTPATAVTASTEVKAGKNGTLIVGQGQQYATIQSAIDALKEGIDGPVTINIKKGVYKEHILVPEVPGMSPANTLTIQSESGDYHDVKIYYEIYTEPKYDGTVKEEDRGMFTFDGADYTTLRGVELTTTNLKHPSVVFMRNMSRHVTIDGCYIHTAMTTTFQQSIKLIYQTARDKAYQNNDYLTVKNCLLEGGYTGVHLAGTGYVKLPKQIGGVVSGNTFRHQGSKAIYVVREQDVQILNNTIENTSTDKSDFNGIDIDAEGAVRVEGNMIHLATDNYAEGLYVRSINGTATTPACIVNNDICVNAKRSTTNGIYLKSASSHLAIAYNTIRITGTAKSSALYFDNEMGEDVNVVNNVLQNEAGGYVYSFKQAKYVKTAKYAHNVLFTTGTVLANDKSDIKTLAEWKAKSDEADSYNEKVTFLSADVLAPAAKGHLLTAQPLAYVATDIEGTARNASTPTIGAYEYNDAAAVPTLMSGYPQVNDITDTDASLYLKADKAGKAHILVKKASETAPTKAEVLAATKTVGLHKGAVVSTSLTSLTKNEEYIAYIVLQDLRGNAGEVVATSKFKASKEQIAEAKDPKVKAEDQTVALGSSVTLRATATEGTPPYNVKWFNGKREEVSATVTPTECDDYMVIVTDKNGKTASDTCRITVTGDAVTATFENLYLDNDAHWLKAGNAVSFVSGTYRFAHNYYPDIATWCNFTYSNATAGTYDGAHMLRDQFNSATTSGVDGSANYLVAYPQGGSIDVLNKADGDSIRGFYITNTAWVVDAVKNGDGMSSVAGGFKKGDYYKVTITGKHADGTKAQVDYYLADYRSNNAADHYYLDTWQWVDLRSLGKVKDLTFKLSGTKKNSFGLTTPMYFCMDNLNGHRKITDAPVQSVSSTIKLSDLFTLDGSSATVTYALADALAPTVKSQVEITADGHLKISGSKSETFSVLVSATQKGKIQFVRIPVSYTTGIDGADASVGVLNVFVDNERIYVNGLTGTATAHIFTANGVLVTTLTASGNVSSVHSEAMNAGVYVVKVTTDGRSTTRRVVIR